MKPKKPSVTLDEVKKTVKGFNPQVMSVVRGGDNSPGEGIDQGNMLNSVCSCHMGDPGVFVTSCGC